MRLSPALLTLVGAPLLFAAFVGCGGDDEIEHRGQTTTSRADLARIAELKRELRELKAHRRHAARRLRGGQLLDSSDTASFDRLASGLAGQVGLTVGRAGDPDSQQFGSVRSGKAWSTIKVPIAAKILSDVGGPGGLTSVDGGLIRRAITASDNSAAAKLFEDMKAHYGGLAGAADAAGEPLREAGDKTTSVSTQGRAGFSPYGQTEWSLVNQHRFMARLAGACVPDAPSARFLLQLMSQVVAGQRWGIGSAGVNARFKGGWGPGPDGHYLVRQMGLLELNGQRQPVVLTIASLPNDGQLATGQQMLTQVARWVVDHVDYAKALPVDC